MKAHKAGKKSSTLLTTQLKKKGLELVPEYTDPALELGPVFTVSPLKSDTSNSDIAYRLYYAGEASKYSASHRNAVIQAAAKKRRAATLGPVAAGAGGKKGLKVGIIDADRDGDLGSEVGSDVSSERSGSSISGVSE